MLARALYKLAASLPCRLIYVNERPYLERYYVGQLFGWTFYLHRFVSADRERHLHNHPWRHGFAVVLSGGYLETYVEDLCPSTPTGCLTKQRTVRRFNNVPGNWFHQISDAKPNTWTLFAHGPRQYVDGKRKGWGFLEPQDGRTVFVPVNVHNGEWWRVATTGRAALREPFHYNEP